MASKSSANRSCGDGMESDKTSLSSPASCENMSAAAMKPWKKPKFVPYEPYKGAVRPMVPDVAPSKKPSPEYIPIHVPPPQHRKKTFSVSSGGSASSGATAKQSLNEKMGALEISESGAESGQTPVTCEAVELRKELKIQHEINAELKNLLVASIGEDWETRVQSLSTDKAILGEYVKQYSDSLNRQTEEKDNISIECDVWRSKFLASSLMVDELARCKAILSCRCQEAREALQALSDEHARFAAEVRDLNRNLKACQSYVDGIHETERPGGGDSSGKDDIMRLVSEANMRSSLILRSFRDRQKYNEARSRPSSPDFRGFPGNREESVPLTPAQAMAAKVLSNLQEMPYVVNENLKSASALYFPINKALPFKCCSHCQGDLKIV